MSGEQSSHEFKSAEMLAFEVFMRTGRRLSPAVIQALIERKFNPNHDPHNGQFTYGLGHGAATALPTSSRDKTGSGLGQRHAPKPDLPKELSRRDIITSGGTGHRIEIRDNPAARSSAPLNELPGKQKVTLYDNLILDAAKTHDVDPDLIRSIVYIETTHGYYDGYFAIFDKNKSILPMNINTDFWGNTWGTRANLKDPGKNIQAGTRMLKAIRDAMPGSSVAKIATVYNDSNARMVNSYGARVAEIYRSKPWLAFRRRRSNIFVPVSP